MCPACIPSIALIVTGASSTSGLFALAVKMFGANSRMKDIVPERKSKEN